MVPGALLYIWYVDKYLTTAELVMVMDVIL